jgi:glycosyltransferase involved in cell wall biosynthesis
VEWTGELRECVGVAGLSQIDAVGVFIAQSESTSPDIPRRCDWMSGRFAGRPEGFGHEIMKLIIQIPCYNEQNALPTTLDALPRVVPGFDRVEWLVVDDGSEDRTVEVARDLGVDHVIRLSRHQGLSRAFVAGLEASVAAGADVIVNTDADNQYCADDIPRLVEPILDGRAELVIGERPIGSSPNFTPTRRALQRLGSSLVRKVSGTDIPDAPSGFRAMSRSAAMRLNVFNEYSYTLETIIQAGLKGMAVASVPVRVNEQIRPSRLFQNSAHYLSRQGSVIVRIFMTYRPFRFFAVPGFISFFIGFLISLRFLFFYFTGTGAGHVQSLILAALLMGIGAALVTIGLIADLISVNRKLMEQVEWKLAILQDSLEHERISNRKRD